MVRHISIYYVKEEGNKEEQIAKVLEALEAIRAETDCIAYSCGKNAMSVPNENAKAGPAFGDVAQVVDFENKEKAAAYPASKAHRNLFEATHEFVDHAIVIDFEM